MGDTRRPVITDHVNGIRDSLEAALTAAGGDTATLTVICEPRPDDDTVGFYLRIQAAPGGILDGDLFESQRDTQFAFQVMAVSRETQDRKPAEQDVMALLDVARFYLRRDTITVDGRSVMKVSLADDVGFSSGALEDNDAPTTTYYAFDRYHLWTTPS